MLSYKDSLKILKKTNALLEGHFLLSSGLHSNKYIQCAKLLSFPNKADKICKSLAKKIRRNFPSASLILAPAIGGIIIGYEIGKLLNIETIFAERVKKIKEREIGESDYWAEIKPFFGGNEYYLFLYERYEIGKSLVEKGQLDIVKEIKELASLARRKRVVS